MRAPLHTTATTVTTVTITRVDYCKRLPVGLLAQESLPTAAHVVTSHWLSFVTNGATPHTRLWDFPSQWGSEGDRRACASRVVLSFQGCSP